MTGNSFKKGIESVEKSRENFKLAHAEYKRIKEDDARAIFSALAPYFAPYPNHFSVSLESSGGNEYYVVVESWRSVLSVFPTANYTSSNTGWSIKGANTYRVNTCDRTQFADTEFLGGWCDTDKVLELAGQFFAQHEILFEEREKEVQKNLEASRQRERERKERERKERRRERMEGIVVLLGYIVMAVAGLLLAVVFFSQFFHD